MKRHAIGIQGALVVTYLADLRRLMLPTLLSDNHLKEVFDIAGAKQCTSGTEGTKSLIEPKDLKQ